MIPVYVQMRAAAPVCGGDGDKGGSAILWAHNVELPSSEHKRVSSYVYTTSAQYKMKGVLYFVVHTEM